MNLRELILGQFESEHSRAIVQFMKHVASIDADVVMFMARKSYCIYDLLVSLGIRGSQLPIVSDRILDLDLTPLAGKRVAIVDDTVILGSSLQSAVERLNAANVQTSIHVLCVNEETLNPELLDLHYVEITSSDEMCRVLCSSEVSALSLMPRPYLVDFPLSQQVRLPGEQEFARLLAGIYWSARNLTAPRQILSGAKVYTFFPSSSVRQSFNEAVGIDVAHCIDIAKVRAFGREVDGTHRFTFVPIVTLKPLGESQLKALLKHLVRRLGLERNAVVQGLVAAAGKPRASFRLVQYILSQMVGQTFFQSLVELSLVRAGITFKDREASVHFGPWSQAALRIIETHAGIDRLNRDIPSEDAIHPSRLPESAETWMRNFMLDKDFPNSRLRLSVDREEPRSGRVEVDMAEFFLALHERYELPAREESRRHGKAIVHASAEEAPYQDRLNKGIAWRGICGHLGAVYRVADGPDIRNQLSLSLDRLNDQGVAVPITCFEDNVVFRAYRHGEDVPWQDGQSDLAYELVSGLLEATKWDSVPKIVLEKALVILIQVGIEEKFIDHRPDATVTPPVATLALDLHGKVVKIRTRSIGAQQNWQFLRKYLVSRGVLTADMHGRYRLGDKLGGSQRTRTAPDRAFGIGILLGKALRPTGVSVAAIDSKSRHRRAGLTDADLIALTTCRDAYSCLAALQAELSIILDWWRVRSSSFTPAVLRSEAVASDSLRLMRKSKARVALRSAVDKVEYWRTVRWRAVVDEVAERLGSADPRDARDWKAFWTADLETVPSAMEERVHASLLRSIGYLWVWASDMALMEAVLVLHSGPQKAVAADLARIADRLEAYSKVFAGTRATKPRSLDARVARLRSWSEAAPDSLQSSSSYCGIQGHMSTRIQEEDHHVQAMDILIAEYGRAATVRRYQHLIWFDLFDSKGNDFGLRGGDVQQYRREVASFRLGVSKVLSRELIRCERGGGGLHAWEGDLDSRNDEKHVAFWGDHSLTWATETLKSICNLRQSHPHIRFRAIVARCTFAGGELVRSLDDGHMEGDACLEHLSLLKVELREIESDYLPKLCPVMLVGADVATTAIARQLRLNGVVERHVKTLVGWSEVTSPVVVGGLQTALYQ